MKDYTQWQNLKTEIESHWLEKYYREGEIWWTVIGLNIGFEEDGKNQNYERPVLVFRKFKSNRSDKRNGPLAGSSSAFRQFEIII